jgi:hypothetical protein
MRATLLRTHISYRFMQNITMMISNKGGKSVAESKQTIQSTNNNFYTSVKPKITVGFMNKVCIARRPLFYQYREQVFYVRKSRLVEIIFVQEFDQSSERLKTITVTFQKSKCNEIQYISAIFYFSLCSHNLFCFISSQTTSFSPAIFLKEFALAGPKPEIIVTLKSRLDLLTQVIN